MKANAVQELIKKLKLIIIFDHESLDRFASKCERTCKKSEMLKACKNMFLESRALCLTLEVGQFLESVHVKCVKMYVECVKKCRRCENVC